MRPSEKQAIEIGRYFLDGVGRKTGRVLFIKHEEKEPNFYWDNALKSDVEWDRLDIWDRMLKCARAGRLDLAGSSDLNKRKDLGISTKFGWMLLSIS